MGSKCSRCEGTLKGVSLRLSVLIPTFNEEELIEHTLDEIAGALGTPLSSATEVIIVDDGSDELFEKVKTLSHSFFSLTVMRNEIPLGKCRSLANGFTLAQAPFSGYLDADLSTPPRYILQALPSLETGQAEVFIGSRHVAGAQITRVQSKVKDFLGHSLGVVARAVLFAGGRNYLDTQCGFKFFTAPLAQALYSDLVAPDGLGDLEVMLRANRMGLRVVECPVEWKDVRVSKRALRRILAGEILAVGRIIFAYRLTSSMKQRFSRQKGRKP